MSYIDELGVAAKAAEAKMTTVGTKDKNAALKAISDALLIISKCPNVTGSKLPG